MTTNKHQPAEQGEFDMGLVRIKQQELMDRVPHDLNPYQEKNMVHAMSFLSKFYEYLNSTGHKPWRPKPLPLHQRVAMRDGADSAYTVFKLDSLSPTTALTAEQQRIMVSCHGMIEESIEFFETFMDPNKTEADKVEEYTDILFFFTEAGITAGITPEQLMAEYSRKWDVNIGRYEALEKGDTSWDKRGEKGL